ncbi:TM2 domain-containing membrane protein YozV [Rhizobium leucaenae]|nr:TM2 domain-containing membrane protein YozV [Rhizobium leucaenae]
MDQTVFSKKLPHCSLGHFKYTEKYDTEKISILDTLELEFPKRSAIAQLGEIPRRLVNSQRSGDMEKKASIAFVLWLVGLLGACGLHRFYVGRTWTGLLWLFTLGLLGVGQLFDLFFLGSMVRQANILNGLKASVGVNTNTNSNAVAPVFNIQVGLPATAQAVTEEPASK